MKQYLLPLFSFCLVWQSFAGHVFDERHTRVFGPFLEWEVEVGAYEGNPFDLEGVAVFRHEGSGEQIRTGLFHAEEGRWKFRFTATRAGTWRFETYSDHGDMNGHLGQVRVAEREGDTEGFIARLPEDKWGREGTLRATIPNYLMIPRDPKSWDEEEEIEYWLDTFIDGHGFTGLHVANVGAAWFDFEVERGRWSENQHLNSPDINPDPRTFDALEKLILMTEERGGLVHFWLWGDKARTQTLNSWASSKTGGINGVADKRLQRYMAARLGPLKGWSVGYGFDLFEWVSDDELDEWHGYMHEQMGWPHLLGGRGNKNETYRSQISDKLDYVAYEHHPHLMDYAGWLGVMQDRPGRLSFSEDRFRIRMTDAQPKDLSGTEETRRLMWDLAMAGGIAAIWGNLEPRPKQYASRPYANPEQLKTYHRFWFEEGRFRVGVNPKPGMVKTSGARAMASDDGDFLILTINDAERIEFRVDGPTEPLPAIAVDMAKEYAEIPLGETSDVNTVFEFPYKSDWAVVAGR
ncbi:DUF5060 domain-containing protein [Pelagicoccus mobilis]|uniref:DUF5060 domain-containing protein n=1 Tax=Pelagicoccus mobilis TaxID=415221 RepID=A0A934VQ82_9BACT|nr:DUF5060 domain-containing protein [Pelagicoccus mobilis]MBK1876229.1 DUF5060 domain-containing protein [Pelagicoccus mobilis]